MWPKSLFCGKVLQIKNVILLLLLMLMIILSCGGAHPVKRDLFIEELLTDGDDLEPISSSNNNNNTKDVSSNSSKPSTISFQHKYLPFRVKIFNESKRHEPLANIDEQPYDFFAHDALLDFDSPYLTEHLLDCTIKYQRFSRFHTHPPRDPFEDELGNVTKFIEQVIPLQVEISGAKCDLVNLVLLPLSYKQNITHLILRGTAIRQIGRHFFSDARLYELRRIDIADNANLTYIDQRAFNELTSLEILRIFHCATLELFHRQALVGLKALRQWVWARNGDGPLNSALFLNLTRAASRHTLPSLQHLHISSSISTSPNSADLKLTKDDLVHLRHIETLQLISCNLRFIHPMTFTFLTNLTSLTLAYNHRLPLDNLIQIFTTLSRLSKTVKLTHVDLTGTLSVSQLPKLLLIPIGKLQITSLCLKSISLTSIGNDDLPPMPNLEKLFLDDNPLESVEDNALDPLENLVHLSMRGNNLQLIRSELFYNLPKLTYLDLSGNPTSPTALEIEPKTFVGLNIQILNLSYRLLDPLPDKAFLGLHKTEELYLRGCDLRQIEYLTFFFLKSLRLLDISENPALIESLRETHDDSFFGLESIETIKMANCNLISSDLDGTNGIFTRTHENIYELDLSGNKIDKLYADQFDQFRQLRVLNLSSNKIRPWLNQTFQQNSYLSQIDLSLNQVDQLTSSMMDDLFRMQNLSFGSNPLQCDCSFELFHGEWLQQTVAKPITYMDTQNPLQSTARYYCINPENNTRLNLQQFSDHCIKLRHSSHFAHSALVSSYLVIVFVLSAFLISLAILAVTFVYYSELNQVFSNYLFNSTTPDLNDANVHYEYDAFVSYNVADSDWIFNELVPNIEKGQASAHRIRLCVYDRDFIAGRPISECILESIRQSRRVILVVSNQFIKSPWCRYETDLAHHHSTLLNRTGGVDGLILIKLEPLESNLQIPVQLEFLLKTRIYLEWDTAASKEERTEFWNKLKQALGISTTHSTKQISKCAYSKWKMIGEKLLKIYDDLMEWSSKEKLPSTKCDNMHEDKVTKVAISGKNNKKLKAADAIVENNPKVQCIKFCNVNETAPYDDPQPKARKVKESCDDFKVCVRL